MDCLGVNFAFQFPFSVSSDVSRPMAQIYQQEGILINVWSILSLTLKKCNGNMHNVFLSFYF